jgi:phage gpG-like protein
MDANNIDREFNKLADELLRYTRDEFPRMARNKALRFIDGNFRAQGWQGRTFNKWKPNRKGTTVLVDKGNLRRSFGSEIGPFMVRIYSSSPYARVHNRGFNGTVSVKGYTRFKYEQARVGTGRYTKSGTERTRRVDVLTGTTQVKAHQRRVSIPKRQFMPEDAQDSPVLWNSIEREVVKAIKKIFN